MIPSSRTPEGEPNRCPVCHEFVRIDPSRPPGDAPCPCCGHLLGFGDPVRQSVSGFPDELFSKLYESMESNPELADRIREQIRQLFRTANDSIQKLIGMDLTDQEIQIIERLVEGKPVSEIAAELDLNERKIRRVANLLIAAI